MRVAIVHPWFPQYRKPFFDTLLETGSQVGISIDIFHGDPPPEWSDRGDSVSEHYAFPMKTRFLEVRGKNLVYKAPGIVWRRGPYDVLILEQAVRNIETYLFLLSHKKTKIAFWGHGKTYTSPVGPIQESLKQFLTRKGERFFAYTEGGARAVAEAGFPADAITVVQNAVDSTALQAAISAVSPIEKQRFLESCDLRGKTGLFIGGLDASKRLDFLLDAADHAYAADQDFRLLIAGSGSSQKFVESASRDRSWLTYLGPVFGHKKAIIMSAAEVLLMPGRVGLVAVDSFSGAIPIVTTNWPWHAPEFEYLTAGHNALVSEDRADHYAKTVIELLNDPERLSSLTTGAAESAKVYTVSNMASNFLKGLEAMKPV